MSAKTPTGRPIARTASSLEIKEDELIPERLQAEVLVMHEWIEGTDQVAIARLTCRHGVRSSYGGR